MKVLDKYVVQKGGPMWHVAWQCSMRLKHACAYMRSAYLWLSPRYKVVAVHQAIGWNNIAIVQPEVLLHKCFLMRPA
jgi:hypothetical protein